MPPNQAKIALSIREFCFLASIGRSLFYEEVKAGRINVLKVGRKTLIPATELNAWLRRLSGNEAHSGPASQPNTDARPYRIRPRPQAFVPS
ncbi:excisionase family DNA-binding protein [Enterovirga sp. DB1703]|uniref:Excisionase family DNA-binding protein n=1 Tax=Enterovirga aerilata TaxID=2730920 RepID=A0A849I7S4_9HYPH|nr:excisionase family DNA-binding protein [Enterovirga sp. DB1703]